MAFLWQLKNHGIKCFIIPQVFIHLWEMPFCCWCLWLVLLRFYSHLHEITNKKDLINPKKHWHKFTLKKYLSAASGILYLVQYVDYFFLVKDILLKPLHGPADDFLFQHTQTLPDLGIHLLSYLLIMCSSCLWVCLWSLCCWWHSHISLKLYSVNQSCAYNHNWSTFF